MHFPATSNAEKLMHFISYSLKDKDKSESPFTRSEYFPRKQAKFCVCFYGTPFTKPSLPIYEYFYHFR